MGADGLFIETHSSAGGPTVVLVHGAPDRSTTFRDVVALLTDCTVVVYDRRGYGRSVTAPPALTMDDHAADLVSLLAALDPPRCVVAHSFGANPTMLAATHEPEMFDAVGLWEPPLVWTDLWPQRVRDHNAAVAESRDPGATIEAVYRRLLGDGWERLSTESQARRRAEGVAFQLDMASELEAPFRFDDVIVPAIVGHGSETSAHHIEGARWLAHRLPDAALHVIPGAGHFACRTHPQQYAQFVRVTLAAAAARASG